jgi:hypothetical protein
MIKTHLIRTALVIAIIVAVLSMALWHMLESTRLPVTIWNGDGEIVTQYKMDGHAAIHARILNPEHKLSFEDAVELVDASIELAGELEPEHGLYIVAESGPHLAFVLSLTHEGILRWQESPKDPFPMETVFYIDSYIIGYPLRWPEWVEDETVTWGYAWLLGVTYYLDHPWYVDLVHSRPLPLDSAFIHQEE